MLEEAHVHGVKDYDGLRDTQRWKMAWDRGTATTDGAE